MGTKQVRLDEDVYAKLKDKKRDDESFSDVIDRLTSDWSLAEWGGWMDSEEANTHREMLAELEDIDHRETKTFADELDLDAE